MSIADGRSAASRLRQRRYRSAASCGHSLGTLRAWRAQSVALYAQMSLKHSCACGSAGQGPRSPAVPCAAPARMARLISTPHPFLSFRHSCESDAEQVQVCRLAGTGAASQAHSIQDCHAHIAGKVRQGRSGPRPPAGPRAATCRTERLSERFMTTTSLPLSFVTPTRIYATPRHSLP